MRTRLLNVDSIFAQNRIDRHASLDFEQVYLKHLNLEFEPPQQIMACSPNLHHAQN